MREATTFEAWAVCSVVGVAVLALLYAFMLARQILREDAGTARMQHVAGAIRTGANAYLRRQFRTIVALIGFLTIALYLTAALAGGELRISLGRAGAFLMGSLFSATVGYVGMNMALRGNVRVASAARRSFRDALRIAYRTGTITGMLTDGLGLFGGTIIFIIYGKMAPEVLLGFGFGGTLLALFMRVGGGIFTKAADVGADLVGKIEKNIPEDDPRNAAVVADLVGDNVGDCAGMAADIFESYEVTIVAAMILALGLTPFNMKWIVFPLLVRAIGVLSSILGTYMVSVWPTKGDAFKAIDLSYDLSAVVSVAGFFLLAQFYVQDRRVFLATTVGVLLAVAFNKYTARFTGRSTPAVQAIARSARTGPATVILSGLASGYESTVWAILLICLAIVLSAVIWAGEAVVFALYGVALCGIGMLTLTGNNVAMDTYGPIVDNADGIAEMAGLEEEGRKILADLDAVGNTTKAITKGIAIASAVIAAVSLFGSFIEKTGLQEAGLNVALPLVFVGMLIGGAVPFLFSSLAIRAVGRAASLIVEEVRRQFTIPGVWEGTRDPDYGRVVDICTSAAQKELLGMGLLAVLTPIMVGLLLRAEGLGGFLAGIILTGQLLAVFMANAGSAWDNAKKAIEAGQFGGKGSEAHKAAVVGDTVGDPLKDTAGPALNPMIKVTNLVSLLVAPLVVKYSGLNWISGTLIAIFALVLAVAIWYSKRETALGVGELATSEAKTSSGEGR